jgi:alkaline phosphatase
MVTTVRFGLVTDIHYADLPPALGRDYRGARERLRSVVTDFNAAKLEFVVELGDFIDAAETRAGEEAYLRAINTEFAGYCGPRHYVLGNHCVWSLTKPQFYAATGARQAPYAFEHGPLRFVVLDACYRADGVAYGARNNEWTDSFLPLEQLGILDAKPSIVFVHQRLDAEPPYGVANAAAARARLEVLGNVRAVFQGHEHAGARMEINGISYITVASLAEGAGGIIVTASAAGIESITTDVGKLPGRRGMTSSG